MPCDCIAPAKHCNPCLHVAYVLTTCRWAPITDADPTACGRPQEYDASKEWAGKKVVLVSVPGAFTPGCQAYHLPPYIQKLSELKSKGVDEVLFIAYNDPFVMAAWGKANGVKDNSIVSILVLRTDAGRSQDRMEC